MSSPKLRFLDGAILILLILPILNWLGWLSGVEAFKRLAPGLDAMHPMTALMFFLAGVALSAVRTKDGGRIARWVGIVASLLVVACMLDNLASKASDADFGFGTRILGDWLRRDGGTAVVSLATSIGLVPAGVALFLFAIGHRRLVASAQCAAFATSMTGVFGMFIYMVSLLPGTPVLSSRGMSVLTAGAMLVLGTALMALRPAEGPVAYVTNDRLPGKIARRMLIAAVLGSFALCLARVSGEYNLRLFPSDLGTVVLSSLFLCFFVLLIWSAARFLDKLEHERVEAERSLAGATQELNRFFELSLDMLVIADPMTGVFKRVSPAVEQTLGWTAEEITTTPFIEFVHPDDVEPTKREVERQVEGGEPVLSFQNRYRHKDGGYRVLSWRSVPRPGGMLYATARDVTDENEMHAALDHERSLLKALVDTAADGIITIDDQGTVLTINGAALSIFGYEREEVVGRNVKMLMPSPYHEEHDRYLADYRDTGEKKMIGSRREVRGMRKDRSELPLDLAVGEVRTNESRIFTGILTDITDRKEGERAVLDAMYEAKRANEAKSEFLSRMSHELRTPMNAILGFSQLIELQYQDEKLLELVGHIRKGGHHLLGLINEVLDIARIESGKFTVSVEPVEVSGMFDEVLSMVQPLALEREVAIEVAGVCDDVHVLADRQRLKQVFINLLSNAVKYNRQGGKVAIICGPAEGGFFRIEFADTGTGIGDERREFLFQPFERLGEESGAGTGLGLALSRQLVGLMGGELTLHATSSEGSTFALLLRASDPPLAAGRPGEAERSVPAFDPGRQAKVLLIEDNLANVRLIERLLADWPSVELLSSIEGRLGYELARRHLPEVILLDLHLPDVDGFEVLNRLKADGATKGIPVIVISADATQKQIDRLIGAGAYAYMTKPIDVAKLLGTLGKLLEG